MDEIPITDSLFTADNATHTDLPSDVWLSDEVTLICQWIIFTILCQAVDIFGIGSNIINIICFVKQGFKDPVNVSLVGLAVADLCCLVTLVWTNICYTPTFIAQDWPFDPIEFQYLITGMPHVMFTRVTGWITAIITIERCLCITMPLKVRSIITPKRVFILIICVFIVLLTSVSPLYSVNRLGMKFYPRRNKTLLGLVATDDRERVEQISFGINNVFISFGAFFIINVCTATLVFKMRNLTRWRTTLTTARQVDNVSNRNRKVAKMVIMISALFIVCFIPNSIAFMAMVLEPQLSVDGKYRNILIVTGGTGFLLETINSSVNIFIYYHMSSKYRYIFRQLFSLRPDQSTRLDDS